MKTLLLLSLLTCALPVYGQFLYDSAPYRGEYFGVLQPTRQCSNERLAIEITVSSDGSLDGTVRDWPLANAMRFDAHWPFFDGGRFTTDITGLGNTVRGKINWKTGTMNGTVKFEGGCGYTFTAYRRYKIAQ